MATTDSDQPQPGTQLTSVVIDGIQDISAFLPILGTDQCEIHCCQGMDRGFWYVAATPLSIFGSLGIIKAGLVTLVISIDIPGFRGPRYLRNAGFSPPGLLKQLTYVLDDDDSIYVAEQNIRSLLRQHRVTEVVPNLYSWPWVSWNLKMLTATMLLSIIGTTPYMYINTRSIGRHQFSSTWMYPMLRVLGSALAAAMIQLIIQFRLMTIVHRRLTFHAVNHLFKQEHRGPPTWWNPGLRSEDCLSKLREDIREFGKKNGKGCGYLLKGPRRDTPSSLNGDDELDDRFAGIGSFKRYPRDNPGAVHGKAFQPIVICTVGFQIALVLGMGASVAGYVGCFKIVQSSTDAIGPLVWLGLELALSIIRLALWAFNPTTDDPPPPIVISSGKPPIAHDIGWNLEDVTVDMHAVVIDIPNAGETDENAMFEYLTQDLAVPEDHVQHVLGSDRNAIQAALQSIVKSPAIPRGSPIIVYISHHSENNEDSEWVGHNEQGMPYSEFFELVRRISETKGENVVVILDTNFPALETDSEHESEPHVLITSCSAGETPPRGSPFTKKLLNSLEEAAANKLTYEEVVKKVANEMKSQTPNCLGTFKKRLIFNGILAQKRPRKVQNTESIGSLILATLGMPNDLRSTPSASRDMPQIRNGIAPNGIDQLPV